MTPAKLVQSLPETIRVGPYDVRIAPMEMDHARAAESFGYFRSLTHTIGIQADFPSPEMAVDTLIHELNHAIFWAYCLEDDDKEERTVATMATAWTQVYRDNPALLDWIAKGLK